MKLLTLENLHNYQLHSINHVIDNPYAGLFLGMGLGKTIITLTSIATLIHRLDISTVLVVGTKKIIGSVWAEEAKNWAHTQHLTFSKIEGDVKKRRRAIEAKADIYLVSRDNIAWLIAEFGGKYMPYDMLVVDELSSFKNSKSGRFKALKHVLDSFSRRIGLTGTPAPNGLIDLWSQIYILDQGERFSKSIGHFRSEYFKPAVQVGAVVYKYALLSESEKRIYDKISDICISMKPEDYLNMPDKINRYITVKFSDETRQLYNKFEEEAVLELQDQEITAVNAAVLSNKLLQFSNGAIYNANREVIEIHQEKLDYLEELVESANGENVIIATAFRHDFTRIMKRFAAYKPKELKTAKDEADWNAGKINMLLLHPASGGHGINLQKGGNIIIWFGLNWSLELYQQLNARLWRQGQTKPVFIFHLISEGTMDGMVMQALESKDSKQQSLMNAVKAIVKKHAK